MARYLVGIDVGGTFTDFVSFDRDTGRIAVWKNLTTPGDPTDGILEGLARIEDRAAIAWTASSDVYRQNARLPSPKVPDVMRSAT